MTDPLPNSTIKYSARQLVVRAKLLKSLTIQVALTDKMTTRTLLAWRTTCKWNYRRGCDAFRRTLRTMLRRFFPCDQHFLRLLSDCQAVIGGEFALAYLLRDDQVKPARLEVFASQTWYNIFVENLDLYYD
ncbi:hypothetical protein C8Q76DRAFT_800998 [Earliella scabrosa]|nr:hypothetical protein C8Q76DRAFT_800998 [Earliella scabrosa]